MAHLDLRSRDASSVRNLREVIEFLIIVVVAALVIIGCIALGKLVTGTFWCW